MQASTVDTPTAGHCGTIFVAIELSQKSWLVTLHSPDKGKMSRHKLEGGDHAALLALIGQVRERAARGAGSRSGGGELLRSGLRRVLAASASAGCRNHELRV